MPTWGTGSHGNQVAMVFQLSNTADVESRGVSTSSQLIKDGQKDAQRSPQRDTHKSPHKNPHKDQQQQQQQHNSQSSPRKLPPAPVNNRQRLRQETALRGQDNDVSNIKQELLRLTLARQNSDHERLELSRAIEQRESVITELRKQLHQKDKAFQQQRQQFEEALRSVQSGKRVSQIESLAPRNGVREELQLVRDAIVSLRGNFRGTDPNQHTLDTLEQAIAVLIERSAASLVNGHTNNENSSRPGEKRSQGNANDKSTKVIYFTERTVTPFMSTINKRLGDITLRDFKNMFDRAGIYRYHFKSMDPEYGMVKEEIMNDDDILPGVDGKIIAWVEEETE